MSARDVIRTLSWVILLLLCACGDGQELGEALACKRGATVTVTTAPQRDICTSVRQAVVIDTDRRDLTLCRKGRAMARYTVAIGYGGADKRREGDGKTPLGRYRLDAPRASAAGFHRFIPIGYPTTEQRRGGYTGGDVGIHGPTRKARWAGTTLNTALDWTRGCVAVGSDREIEAIEAWVRRHHVREVVIR